MASEKYLHPPDYPGVINSNSHGAPFTQKNLLNSSKLSASNSLAGALHRAPKVLGVLSPPGCCVTSPPCEGHVLAPRDLHNAITEDFNLLTSPCLILAIRVRRAWLVGWHCRGGQEFAGSDSDAAQDEE